MLLGIAVLIGLIICYIILKEVLVLSIINHIVKIIKSIDDAEITEQ